MSTGIFGRDVDSERLKKLEAPDLRIAEDPPQKAKTFGTSVGRARTWIRPLQHAFGEGLPRRHRQEIWVAIRTTPPGRRQERRQLGKPTDLRRLSEWIKRQRDLQKKDD